LLLQRIFKSLGPAIIVASVVLGPGSILTSSRVGIEYGYQMLWVIALASLLMIGMTTLGALLGVSCTRTPCDEVAHRAGRPLAVFIGLALFLIVACFQSSNNVAVLAAMEEFLPAPQLEAIEPNENAEQADEPNAAPQRDYVGSAILIALNALIIAVLFGVKALYRPIELMMMALVMTMLAGFSINLWFANPSLTEVVKGFIPSLPASPDAGFLPQRIEGKIVDPWWALQGMIATTLSVAGAFYQCYLVKEKGWNLSNVRQSLTDSAFGIVLLGTVSAIVMMTSAAALHGLADPGEFTTAGDVARQLEPLFGSAARILFSLGIFAAAFSSFLGNALVGGTVLSDGLGLGSSMDSPWPKRLTVLALLLGMVVAVAATGAGFEPVLIIVFAQALTVLGVPMLAVVMLWLAYTTRKDSGFQFPIWVLILGWIATILSTALLIRTAWRLYLQFS